MSNRIGLIGAGGHGRHHLRDALHWFDLTAVCDPSQESLSKVREIAGNKFKVFDTANQLLSSGLVDAAIITTPDEYHARELVLAITYGIHTLVDKPIATTIAGLDSVQRSLQWAAKEGIQVTSCHPRRFDPPYLWIKNNLPRLVEMLGALVKIDLTFWYHKPGEVPGTQWKMHRSLLLDHFPHEIDYLRFLLGANLAVKAYPLADSYDHYSVAGTIGSVTFGCVGTRRLEHDHFPEEIRLTFDRGVYTLTTIDGQIVSSDYDQSRMEHRFDLERPTAPTNYDVRNGGVMNDFVGMLEGKPSTLSHHDLIVNTRSAIELASGHPIDTTNW